MEIELFIGIYAIMCVGVIVSAIITVRKDNYKALAVILVSFCISAVVLFGIAAYMAPFWATETLSEFVIVN